MKIVTKDNYDRDLFTEKIIAENVSDYIGKQLIECWNNKYWDQYSNYYLELVEDDYECYNGYKDL